MKALGIASTPDQQYTVALFQGDYPGANYGVVVKSKTGETFTHTCLLPCDFFGNFTCTKAFTESTSMFTWCEILKSVASDIVELSRILKPVDVSSFLPKGTLS